MAFLVGQYLGNYYICEHLGKEDMQMSIVVYTRI